MYRILLLVVIVLPALHAKDAPKYPVRAIPAEMTRGMYAVIREQQQTFVIVDRSRSVWRVHKAITILNAKAKDYAKISVGYDKLRKVDNLKATLYDANGNVIRKLKSGDIIDHSAISDFSLFEDNRVKFADLSQNTYPYTVEYEYEVHMKYLYSIPDFVLYYDDEVSIEASAFTLVYPKNLKPQYRLLNAPEPGLSTQPDGREAMEWKFTNVKPSRFEKDGPPYFDYIPSILVTPTEFEHSGYPGKMDSWDNLARWQMSLNTGRSELPEATKRKVKELISGKQTEEEKIRVLYEYLQRKTRYVSIQRGIGGMQPFEARVVDEMSYGDCKALSNYMVALLREAGIRGYYTLIHAGSDARPIFPDFTADYFNHIVVAVPQRNDTIWLECTSAITPMGYLGNSTCDRYALMVKEDGGALVRTPAYAANRNVQLRNATVIIDASGNAKASVTTTYTGLQTEYDGALHYAHASPEDQRKWIQKTTAIPSFDVMSFTMSMEKQRLPKVTVEAVLALNRWATVSGSRIFLTPNLMNRSTYLPEKLEERKTKVVRKQAYTDTDTIVYHFPEKFYPEYLPDPVSISSRFGQYQARFMLDAGRLTYIRTVTMNKGYFPPESYQELIDFYKAINKADHTKLVLLNKT